MLLLHFISQVKPLTMTKLYSAILQNKLRIHTEKIRLGQETVKVCFYFRLYYCNISTLLLFRVPLATIAQL